MEKDQKCLPSEKLQKEFEDNPMKILEILRNEKESQIDKSEEPKREENSTNSSSEEKSPDYNKAKNKEESTKEDNFSKTFDFLKNEKHAQNDFYIKNNINDANYNVNNINKVNSINKRNYKNSFINYESNINYDNNITLNNLSIVFTFNNRIDNNNDASIVSLREVNRFNIFLEFFRKYLNARLHKAGISKIYIERTLKLVTVTINAARPGLIIGRMGTEVDKLKEELGKITGKDVQINISEIKKPELDAVLVAQTIAGQIEGRMFYRRAIKTAITSTMRSGAEGIKVSVSGRIGGAEMARTEHYKEGRTPLHTLRADIDYSQAEAHTTYGRIGVKVWICRGLIYGKKDLFQAMSENSNRGNRRPSGNGRGFRGERSERGGERRRNNKN